jgi:hypothetical protein
MLTCTPQSLCSWNFTVSGPNGEDGAITFRWCSEQGTLTWKGESFEIVKHGVFSGSWSLEQNQNVLVSARKLSSFSRSFVLSTETRSLELHAVSMFQRSFELRHAGLKVGLIYPKHVFSRASFIDCSEEVTELEALFAFWLVALMWKRSSRHKS